MYLGRGGGQGGRFAFGVEVEDETKPLKFQNWRGGERGAIQIQRTIERPTFFSALTPQLTGAMSSDRTLRRRQRSFSPSVSKNDMYHLADGSVISLRSSIDRTSRARLWSKFCWLNSKLNSREKLRGRTTPLLVRRHSPPLIEDDILKKNKNFVCAI